MKLQKYHLVSHNENDKYYSLYFETVKKQYIGFNADSYVSTEYWTDLDECIGFSINHNNGNRTFVI